MVKRFGVSLEEDLLEAFDEMIAERSYTNRSEAIRDLIRDALVKREWLSDQTETAGAVVIVYDHHRHELSGKLARMQHDEYNNIISTLHVHLDHDNCLETVLLKGKASDIKRIADSIIATKGVKHGQFVGTTVGKELK